MFNYYVIAQNGLSAKWFCEIKAGLSLPAVPDTIVSGSNVVKYVFSVLPLPGMKETLLVKSLNSSSSKGARSLALTNKGTCPLGSSLAFTS